MTRPPRAQFRLFVAHGPARPNRRRQAVGGIVLLAMCVTSGCEQVGRIRPGAESILDILAEPTTTEAVALATDRYDADRRFQGTTLLASRPFAGEPLYIKLFVDNVRDDDASVRVAAVRALANHGDSSHAALLVEALQDDDALVRLEAARGLQRLHSADAISPLLRIIALDQGQVPVEPATEVRAEAAHALGQYADRSVLQPLIASLGDPQLAVNHHARASLATLTGQDFGFDQRAWLAWLEKTPDVFAAGRIYRYPAFSRSRRWFEYIPLMGTPPNEVSATPAGLSPVAPQSRPDPSPAPAEPPDSGR